MDGSKWFEFVDQFFSSKVVVVSISTSNRWMIMLCLFLSFLLFTLFCIAACVLRVILLCFAYCVCAGDKAISYDEFKKFILSLHRT
jgi:hypothetical protein